MMIDLIDEATESGARLSKACAVLKLTPRTLQRWKAQGADSDDRRRGPRRKPKNALSEAERKRILQTVNAPAYRNLSPKQIVPTLADQGIYLASESTIYRILRQEKQLAHRAMSEPPQSRVKATHVAKGPNEVWSWDITYLKTAVRGSFFYLYLMMDIWSRKIVGFEVHEAESTDFAAHLLEESCRKLALDPEGIVLHQDNGSPMRGATLLATLQRLGMVASFSRPRVSDDNAYSESLFRTLKYRPEFPSKPFESLETAQAWVSQFVRWYNTEHLHSSIRFVTPDTRHFGLERGALEQRTQTYQRARRRHPERWARQLRNWNPVGDVYLNPNTNEEVLQLAA